MELIVSGMDKFQATKNYEASAQFIKAAMVSNVICICADISQSTKSCFDTLIH